MMSPVFEGTREGLRSAVLLRYRVQGHPTPEAATVEYLRVNQTESVEELVGLIAVVIEDIEHITSAYPVS